MGSEVAPGWCLWLVGGLDVCGTELMGYRVDGCTVRVEGSGGWSVCGTELMGYRVDGGIGWMGYRVDGGIGCARARLRVGEGSIRDYTLLNR